MSTSPHADGTPPIRDDYEYALDQEEVKLEVPGYRQLDEFSCGPVAAWSIIETFHPGSIAFGNFYLDCKMDEDGSNEYQIIDALRKHGVGVGIRDELDFEDVVKTIDRGFPILGSVTHPGYADHWLVIYGYGLNPERLFTCNHPRSSGLHGREEMKWKSWLRLWDDESRYLVCWGK
jgi:hypothetical protein